MKDVEAVKTILSIMEQMQKKLHEMEIKLDGSVNLFNSTSDYIQSFKSCVACGLVLLDNYVHHADHILCIRCSKELELSKDRSK